MSHAKPDPEALDKLVDAIRHPAEHTLASVIDGAIPQAMPSWRFVYSLAAARAVLDAGYHQILSDEATLEKVGRAIWADGWKDTPQRANDDAWAWVREQVDWGGYRSKAQAVFRVLLDGDR